MTKPQQNEIQQKRVHIYEIYGTGNPLMTTVPVDGLISFTVTGRQQTQ